MCEVSEPLEALIDKEVKEKLSALAPQQIQDTERSIAAFSKACSEPTNENFAEVVKLIHDREMRTCVISSHTFTQILERNSSGSWVVSPEAKGECGVVQLDRFEKGTDTELFWDYVSRKVITNPKGSSLLLQCKDLDEDEYLFSWKSREFYLSCNYFEFGAF